MSENTNIEWCDHTFNPWTGCTKVSPGCDHCYAEGWSKRSCDKVGKWGPGAPRVRTTPANWAKPLKWQANAEAFRAEHGRRQRVFCASLADVFDNQVPSQWRADLFSLIAETPDLDWLLLTKRIGNARAMIAEAAATVEFLNSQLTPWTSATPWPNVWIGATVVNQEEADRDIQKLLDVPARVRFLSMEPLLGPVDLEQACDIAEVKVCAGTWGDMPHPTRCAAAFRHGSVVLLDWVIVGGESGPGARPMHPDWARSLRDQCASAGVPFLFKQWGEWEVASIANGHHDCDMARNAAHWVDMAGAMHKPSSLGLKNPYAMVKVGKKAAGRLLDGVEHNGFPGSA